MARLISEIIASVKERSALPANQDRYTDTDITEFIREELEDTVLPFMTSLIEEFFVFTENVAMTDSSGNPRYPALLIQIPKRAYGRALRDLQYLDTGNNRYNIPEVNPEDKDLFNRVSVSNFVTPSGFYFQNDSVKLIGTTSILLGGLEFSYYLKVPAITDTNTLFAPVSNITYASVGAANQGFEDNFDDIDMLQGFQVTTTVFTADITNIPSGQGFITNGLGIFDVFNRATGAYSALEMVCTVAGTGTTATFTTTSLDDSKSATLLTVQPGEFPVASPYTSDLVIVPRDLNCYSPIPSEVDNLLVSAVCGRLLEGLGDTEGLASNMAIMKKLQSNLSGIYGKRVIGETRKVVSRRGIYNFMRRRYIKGRA